MMIKRVLIGSLRLSQMGECKAHAWCSTGVISPNIAQLNEAELYPGRNPGFQDLKVIFVIQQGLSSIYNLYFTQF